MPQLCVAESDWTAAMTATASSTVVFAVGVVWLAVDALSDAIADTLMGLTGSVPE